MTKSENETVPLGCEARSGVCVLTLLASLDNDDISGFVAIHQLVDEYESFGDGEKMKMGRMGRV